MKLSFDRKFAASLAAITVALGAQAAVAQGTVAAGEEDVVDVPNQDEVSNNSMGDIVVTARKIGETAQSLPITIAAFSGEELENKVVMTAADLQTVTPGLTVSNNLTGGVPTFAIRGTATELGIDGGVALYFNDVPLISTIGIMNSFFDVSTVEVLKGPQGTQFGTNTTGGTISVRTNLPTDEFEGYAKVGYGNFDRRELEGMINIPVNDVLGFRFAGNYAKRDGYVDNPDNGGVMPKFFQDENHYALRGTMKLETGAVTNVTILDHYNRDEKPFGYIPVRFGMSLYGMDLRDQGAQLGDYNTIHVAPNFSGTSLPMFGKAKLYGLQNRTEIEFLDNLSFRNVIGMRDDKTHTSEDTSGTGIINVSVNKLVKATQWSDDMTLRFTNNAGNWRASLGAYYSELEQKIGLNVNVLQGLYAFYGFPAELVSNSNTHESRVNNSKALYFNTDIDLSETIGLNGGVRYNWDKVNSFVTAGTAGASYPNFSNNFFPTGDYACNSSNLIGYANFNPDNCTASRSASFKAPSWTIGITNQFSNRVLGYAKVSHGYLAGGTNFSLRDVGRTTFQPEKTTMGEVGLKADWFVGDRPIRTNVALYYGETKNKQVFANANYNNPVGSTGFGVVNAAKQSVYGADVEIRFSPVENLTLDLGYNYVHSKFDEFLYPGLGGDGTGMPNGQPGDAFIPAVDLSGATPSQTPEHQLNLAATYRWPVSTDTGDITTTVSGYYTSKITQANRLGAYDALLGGDLNVLPGYFLTNASMNWDNVLSSPISAQLWVRNLFDKHYATGSNIQFATFGWATNVFGAPRTYGGSLTFQF